MSGSLRSRAGLAFCLAIAATLAGSAVRAAKEFEKVGTIGAQFLKLPVGARGVAMGWAFTSVADDASAVYWNPAGLARLESKSLAGNHTPWLADIQFTQATYVTTVRFLPGTFAFDARSLYMPRDEVRTVLRPEGEGTSFDAGDFALGMAYSRSLTDKFSTGIGVNWVASTLATYTAHAVTFDFGTLYDTGYRSLRIGMAIQNIGSDMTFLDEPAKVPTVFRVGMSARIIDRGAHRCLLAGEFSHPPDNSERANAGVEYSIRQMVFFRGGWFYRFDAERFTGGLGVRIPAVLAAESRFDYAYTEMHNLPAIHRLSAEFRF
jgi:hypothetical protein